MFNLGRLQRDVGDGSTVGALVTDREAEGEFNRVGGVDGRIRFGGAYTFQFQAAGSWTKRWVPSSAGGDTSIIDGDAVAVAAQELTGHLVQASVDRSGRNYGFRMQVKDIPGDFRASSGYLRRRDVTDFFMFQRLNFFGPPGARLESWGANLFGNRIYPGRSFWDGGGADEGMLSLRFNLNLRGNTRIEFGGSNKFFVLNPARYDDYAILLPDGSQIAGDALVASIREMRGLGGLGVQVRSSYFKSVSFNTELQREETPIFAEGTRGVQWSAEAGAEARPTGSLRLESSIRHALIERQNGSEYSQATLLRGRAEYQLSRAVFLRAVGQYSLEDVDSLRAPGGIPYLFDDAPFRIRSGDIYSAGLPQTNPLRVDLLFSYQPSPGTVFFLGYSREMLDNEAFRFSPLEPRADGLFLKLSYLFRS
jgi:hypothetical protein